MKYLLSIILSGSVLLSANVTANSEFQKWMQQQKSSFQEYKDKRDKEFTAFLKANWKQTQLLQGKKRDPKPKPVTMPVAPPVSEAPVTKPVVKARPVIKPVKPVPASPVIVKPAPVKPPAVTSSPRPIAVPIQKPVAPAKKYKGVRLTFDFLGETETLYYDRKLRVNVGGRINKQRISDIWSSLSKADYEPLVEQLVAIKDRRGLNDWAFVLMVNEVAGGINNGRNTRSFIDWFLLIKAGYEARIAYNDTRLFLLLPSKQPLFAVPYFTFDGIRFYAVSFDGRDVKLGQVYTYDGRYPGATESLDMRLTSDMVAGSQLTTRNMSFKFKGKQYTIKARYDNQRVDFMNTYPQMDLSMYFASTVATPSAESLRTQLAGYIEGMSQLEAVNFLLRFVQTSLEYKTDDEQFGKENYLFPEETLYYRYSDCEDRAVLFTWLVKTLLGLDVIALDYPGHVATAVLLDEKVKGDRVSYNGKSYTVADPTYINAVAGMTMPKYKQVNPKVITTQ